MGLQASYNYHQPLHLSSFCFEVFSYPFSDCFEIMILLYLFSFFYHIMLVSKAQRVSTCLPFSQVSRPPSSEVAQLEELLGCGNEAEKGFIDGPSHPAVSLKV